MEQGKPLISVIVPLYNAEPYIVRCLDSILAQTWPHMEVIVVDDGSTDDGARLCRARAAGDSRLSVVRLARNRGPSAARNEGIRRAEGAYVSFVDADDYVEPELLERLYRSLRETGADISTCAADGLRLESAPAETFTRREAIRCLARGCPFNLVPWGKLYSRELVRDHLFDEKIFYSEDLLFLYQLLKHAEKVSYIPDRLYHYVCREGSQVHSPVDRRKRTTLLVHDIVCGDVARNFPEAETDYRYLALEIDRCLGMMAVKNGTEGSTLVCLKEIRKDLRRRFGREALALFSRRKDRAAVRMLYVSAALFWGAARLTAILKGGIRPYEK